MNSFDEICKEIIVLSDLLSTQKFRACFVEHFTGKIKILNDICANEKINANILQKLQLKLLEPITLHLRTTEKSMDKCLLVQCLIRVMSITPINNDNLFFHLYLLLFSQIFENEKSQYKISEELKMSVFEAGSSLLRNTKINVLQNVYKQESGEKLSIGIFLAIQTSRNERSIQLRLQAFDFLLDISQYKENISYNRGMYKRLGDLFMLYLPGTIAPIQEIILRDETQHHLITVKALTCWGHILCLILSDSESEQPMTDTEVFKQWVETCNKSNNEKLDIDINKALAERKRTKTWLSAAAITLKPLISKISEVRKHSNSKCRLELIKIMIKLFENCCTTLKDALTSILDVVVGFENDEDNEIRQIAKVGLENFEKICEKKKRQTFLSVIESNFYSLLNKLPGIIHSGNEKILLPSLRSMSGYLRILGRMGKLQQLVMLLPTLKKILFVIQIGFQLESYPEISNQEFSVWDTDDNSKIWSKPWKRFHHFTDVEIQGELENICRLLGEHSETETIIDYLLDVYFKEQAQRREILLILGEILLGMNEIKSHVVNQLLNFYLNPENLYLVLEVDEEHCLNLRESHSNIMTVALIMENIKNLFKTLSENFSESYVLACLYAVIERMGSSYSIIKLEATKAAFAIADASGLNGNISLLIKNNVDYLTYHLVTKLRRNNAGVFDVVTVLMKNSAVETMPNLEEIINTVLKTSSRNLSSPLTVSYLRLFQTFVLCLRKCLKRSSLETSLTPLYRDELESFFEYVKKKQEEKLKQIELEKATEGESKAEMEDIDEETEEESYMLENEKKANLPKHISLTVAVTSHCLNFLASKDKNTKLVVLEILNDAVWILADYENELLPLVHKIWSPLVTRFDQFNDIVLIKSSFTLLCTLARTSKQFIRSRTLKNVLPTLQNFLVKEAPKSKRKDSSSGYYFTQNYKLQRLLLDKLGVLTTDLELFERQTDLVVESALPYLSALQPNELQVKCRELFIHLQTHDPYLVWYKLQPLTTEPEYTKNVDVVLNHMLN